MRQETQLYRPCHFNLTRQVCHRGSDMANSLRTTVEQRPLINSAHQDNPPAVSVDAFQCRQRWLETGVLVP